MERKANLIPDYFFDTIGSFLIRNHQNWHNKTQLTISYAFLHFAPYDPLKLSTYLFAFLRGNSFSFFPISSAVASTRSRMKLYSIKKHRNPINLVIYKRCIHCHWKLFYRKFKQNLLSLLRKLYIDACIRKQAIFLIIFFQRSYPFDGRIRWIFFLTFVAWNAQLFVSFSILYQVPNVIALDCYPIYLG